MAILSILNPKGGSGKTTLSTNLARALHDQGRKVLLVDSDPQGSARDWHAAKDNNPVPLVALDRANNLRSLPTVAAGYDFVLIDGAAKLEDMVAAAVKVSDAVLIPVQPSPYDIWAAADLVDLVKARQEITEGRPAAAFIVTRAIRRTKLGREVYEALSAHGFPVFASATVQRQIYPQTAASGETVFDASHREAISETLSIVEELTAFLDNPTSEDTHDSDAQHATA